MWAHSQGSVLSAFALAGMGDDLRRRVAFVTCGSPLVSVYSRYFPGYVTRDGLERLSGTLYAWSNVYRKTDYVGQQLFDRSPPHAEVRCRGKDIALSDPSPALLNTGRRTPLRHADYWSEPEVLAEVERLARQLEEGGNP